ncbi:glycoside hydrolase family 32 protein [Pasteurella multocida]|uniref:glycoside hydrolase family 32 protein n=1 Tax=Pasteurella multocida TaxID=747 RepID=UPI00397B52D4
MYIFNQGKYKSLHAQQVGELAQIRQHVLRDTQFRPTYHLAPETGLLNDPNGLVFDGEKYHIFYQWFPYAAIHGMKHWKHFMTYDFHYFQAADPLIPDELFESHGCYSGGALLWQDQIVAFYTGNTRNAENQRIPHQNIAIFKKDGTLLKKRCLLNQAPTGYTEHVRDPKPFITEEGKIRFILGAQREDLSGTALIYEMTDLDATPQLIGEFKLPDFDNQQVFMWECPDLLKLQEQDLFLWSPQGKAQKTYCFQNHYHATYALGQYANLHFSAQHIEELDYGFDFYAPQSIQGSEGIYYAWVGLPDLTYPTDEYQWHSMLSLPRQFSIQQGILYQRPIPQVYAQCLPAHKYWVEGKQQIPHLDRSYVAFDAENQPFTLRFFTNQRGQQLILRYQNGILTLDRTYTTQTALMQQFGEQRHCILPQLNHVEIFFDRSVVEIFLNQGEKVMTSRFFIADRENALDSSRPLCVSVAELKPIILTP